MIRVVFCVDSFEEAGTELNAVRTAERLDRSRFDLRVVSLSTRGSLQSRYQALDIPIVPFPIGSLFKPPPVREAWRLRCYLKTERIDVFHAHGIYDNVFGVPVAAWAGVPAILASRRWWQTPVRQGLGALNRMAYRIADGVLANSAGVGRILTAEDAVPSDRVHLVPNFVEDELLCTADAEWVRTCRASLGIPASAVVAGVVARLRPEKDHQTLLRAWVLLGERWPDLHLVFVGDGPEERSLREMVQALELGARVHFAGQRSSRPTWHAAFDISLLSSTSEGFPNTLLEAMACRRPLVATAVGGVPDAIVHGDNGFLVNPGDVEGFAHHVATLVEDPQLRARMGGRSGVMAQRFTAASAIGALQDLYVRLLDA